MHRWAQNVWQECFVIKVSQVSSDLVNHSDLVFLTWGSVDFLPAWVEAATFSYSRTGGSSHPYLQNIWGRATAVSAKNKQA